MDAKFRALCVSFGSIFENCGQVPVSYFYPLPTPGDGDGQGGLACCDSWGRKESDTTERLN